jgi:hypothetical protein
MPSFRVKGVFLSPMLREMLVCNVLQPAICIDSRIQLWCFVSWRRVCVCVCVCVCVACVQFLFENG